jgi:predicted GNAT superfamily acetyltransferase
MKSGEPFTVSNTTKLRIEACSKFSDFHAIEDLHKLIWEASDRESVPYHIMVAMSKNGGAVIAAWDNEEPVGISLSFVARRREPLQVYQYLHMVGVLPKYRNVNVAFQLMQEQRKAVSANGLNLITWTFDPLESVNAYLYFHKLGAVSRTYTVDYYGTMPEAVSAGLPSDRLYVEWHLRKPEDAAVGTNAQREIQTLSSTDNWMKIPCLLEATEKSGPKSLIEKTDFKNEMYRIEIPADIQIVKQHNMKEAVAWRLSTRDAFLTALSKGYTVCDFLKPSAGKNGSYLLVRTGP